MSDMFRKMFLKNNRSGTIDVLRGLFGNEPNRPLPDEVPVADFELSDRRRAVRREISRRVSSGEVVSQSLLKAIK